LFGSANRDQMRWRPHRLMLLLRYHQRLRIDIPIKRFGTQHY
jgi:hypothetical protein